jgi:ABC-2 type transport system ATP-binding protein
LRCSDRNGGGKTTLFKILSTALIPTDGTAKISGFDVRARANEVRRRIGIVFQSPSLDKKLTVLENLSYHGQLYGLRGKALVDRVNEMMERLMIADRASSRVETLSGGLARRVELAKGLLHRPEVLILDEPSVGLDPGARRDLWLYLQNLRENENVTVLVTTHLIDEGDRSDHVLVLHQGRVVASGTPESLKREIGGDVIAISTKEPEKLVTAIRDKFSIRAGRIERHSEGRETAGTYIHQPNRRRVSRFNRLGQSVAPTLEDVFIARTGHRFWEDQ